MGVHENAFIAKIGSCENACMLRRVKRLIKVAIGVANKKHV